MKSTTPPTMTSGESERDVAVDRILDTARAAWRAGIERDERTTRPWSELRLARATGPEARRRSTAGPFGRNDLAIAVGVAACTLGVLGSRHLRLEHEAAAIRPDLDSNAPVVIVASAGNAPAAEPGTEPAAVATSPSEATAAADPSAADPEALALAHARQAPSPRAHEPKPSPAEPVALPQLPPLPPPDAEIASTGPFRRVSVSEVETADPPAGKVHIEVRTVTPSKRPISPLPAEAQRAMRLATQELVRGEVERARERLRALARNEDSIVVYEAARALARSHRDPKEQLAVWDQALPRLRVEPYRALAAAERARIAAKVARNAGD